jgi:hypothetical protein
MDYTAEQTFEQEEYTDFFDDEEKEEEVDYDEDKEEFEEGNNAEQIEETLFDQQYDLVNENEYAELTFANLPFSMKDLYGGPLTSLQQIKMLYSDKNEKINFAELSDSDLFKVITTISAYSNKVHVLLKKDIKDLIESMLAQCDKIPDIKYKNPLACLLSYYCVNKKGIIIQDNLDEIYSICYAVKLQNYDIFRYCRMWQKIYNKSIDCDQ